MSFTWDELEHMHPGENWRIPLPPTCRKCSYILTGLTQERCPECGEPFSWKEVRQRASRTWALVMRLRHANQDATMGVVMGLFGWMGLGLALLMGMSFISAILHLLAIMLAVLTVVLGSQVLNLRRVPKWARPYAGDPPPNTLLGTLAIVLGITLLFGSLVIW